MSKVININADKFQAEVLSSDVPVLVDFWAPWCGPCRAMAPVLDDLSERYAGKAKVVKVDVDAAQNIALAQQYSIRSIPNMKLFKNGAVVEELIGMRPMSDLEQAIDGAVS